MKPNTISLFFALIASALAIMSFYGSRIALSADSALAVVAVCTTMIVGVSVLDRMTIHDLEKRLNNLEKTEKKLEEIKTNVNIANHVAFGLAFLSWKPESTIKEFYRAIEIAMRAGDVKRTHACVKNLKRLIDMLNEKGVTETEKEKMKDNKIDINDTDLYPVFKNQLSEIFKSLGNIKTN